jgi:hypothetical protein
MEQEHLLKQLERADRTLPFQASRGRAADALFQVVGLARIGRWLVGTHSWSPPEYRNTSRAMHSLF